MRLMLDTNVLVKICHPTAYLDVKEWFRAMLARGDSGPEIVISVLADYEIRRGLVAAGAVDLGTRLDRGWARSSCILSSDAE